MEHDDIRCLHYLPPETKIAAQSKIRQGGDAKFQDGEPVSQRLLQRAHMGRE